VDAVNIYRSALDGTGIRRLTLDQVSTQFPALLPDGRVIYTRWEYNDRGQIYPQALFTMYPDGTRQEAFYGNNSWYPTSLIQARGIPGSRTVLAVVAGHHTEPMGKLVLIDVSRGREEGAGVQLVAPERPVKYKQVDKAEQEDVLFQYPYPLNEDEYLTGMSLFGTKSSKRFGIYWVNRKGERELLAGDLQRNYRRPMPLAPRPVPESRPSSVDPRKKTGAFYVVDVYHGPGLEGIERGSVKWLRVVALDYRPAAVRTTTNKGAGGHARVNTPVSVGGAWDTKTILGDAKVHEDGSCYFEVPANTPVYFQALDENGAMIQSMRSWSTLMPGEIFSCVGCHESKSSAPLAATGRSMALKAGPSPLKPFYDVHGGFSFNQQIQPILNRHCVSCHNGASIRTELTDGKAPAFGHFTKYLANASVISAEYPLPNKTVLGAAELTWKGTVPKEWTLLADQDGEWVELVSKGSEKRMKFGSIETHCLKLEVVPDAKPSNLVDLRLFAPDGAAVPWGNGEKPFSLTGAAVDEPISGRRWSEAYLRLIGAELAPAKIASMNAFPNPLVNWISPQSAPVMMKPYETGATQSKLISMLKKGHSDVKLTREELDKLRAWIDLCVPYCGEYEEANIWSDQDKAWYKDQKEKRERLAGD